MLIADAHAQTRGTKSPYCMPQDLHSHIYIYIYIYIYVCVCECKSCGTCTCTHTVPGASFQLLPVLSSHLGEMYHVWVKRHFHQDFLSLSFFHLTSCPSCETAVNVKHMIKNDIKQNIKCFLSEHLHHRKWSRRACLEREIWNNCWMRMI